MLRLAPSTFGHTTALETPARAGAGADAGAEGVSIIEQRGRARRRTGLWVDIVIIFLRTARKMLSIAQGTVSNLT